MNIAAASSKPEWTLADFLSTYRYWALFLASLFVTVGGQGLDSVLPLIARAAATSYQTIAIYYLGTNFGWAAGAFVAFVIVGRSGWAALIAPLIFCGAITAGILAVPTLLGNPVFLFLFGMAVGMVRAVFPLAVAIFLVAGRPTKIDFACALTLIWATVLTSGIVPMGASWLFEQAPDGLPVVWGFLGCLCLALLALLPARHPAFEETPRPRHKPLQPRRRSPILVALALIVPSILLVLIALRAVVLQWVPFSETIFEAAAFAMAAAAGVIFIFAVIYFAYWIYHIHGELAGAAASQRLLTPVAATLIALFAPLGLPILIMTLGDLLNDRARDKGQGGAISIPWLAIWCFLVPPIAMAMIQNAANKSYPRSAPSP